MLAVIHDGTADVLMSRGPASVAGPAWQGNSATNPRGGAMSQSHAELVTGLYAAFGRGDVPAILSVLDEDIEWHTPTTLPHGGAFHGRAAIGGFFQGIGEHWESLEVDVDKLVSGGETVVALVKAHGRLRASGEELAYSAAHAWTVRDSTPVRFDEYVDVPATLAAADNDPAGRLDQLVSQPH